MPHSRESSGGQQRRRSWSAIEAAFPIADGAVRIEDIEVVLLPLAARVPRRWTDLMLGDATAAVLHLRVDRYQLRVLRHTPQVCQRPDGSLWQLGAGSFGTVRTACCCKLASPCTHSSCCTSIAGPTANAPLSRCIHLRGFPDVSLRC